MGWFDDMVGSVRSGPTPDRKPTPGRPAGSVGDTGLGFSAWISVAFDTLTFASRDDDPRCQLVLCREARKANIIARSAAVNPRQVAQSRGVDIAIESVERIAADTPALPTPHAHDPTAG